MQVAHKQDIVDQNKHIVRIHHVQAVDTFLEGYKHWSPEVLEHRYQGMLGTDGKEYLSHSTLVRIWKKFMVEERRDYILRHNTLSMDDLVRIGIDKFIMTNGWKKPSDVSSWRNNVVRIGVCPDCKDQFVPLMFQTNHGLCKTCRVQYNTKAIRKFITNVLATNDRYLNAMDDALMDFYIMFYSDDEFRHLFKKGDPFAEDFAERDIETPEWVKEEEERRMQIMQHKMLEMVPEDE